MLQGLLLQLQRLGRVWTSWGFDRGKFWKDIVHLDIFQIRVGPVSVNIVMGPTQKWTRGEVLRLETSHAMQGML